MKILALDTSTKFLSLGIYDERKIYELKLELGPKLSMLLVPTIERALSVLNYDIGTIDYLACGLGPGSFTALRVGIATAKGLAWALNKPLIGVPTLDIMAQGSPKALGLFVAIVDAKRSLIYCGIYNCNGKDLKRAGAFRLLSLKELMRKIKESSRRQAVTFFGDAAGLYKNDILKDLPKAVILDSQFWYPLAHNMIGLAMEKIKKKDFLRAEKIKPIYLYPKECQIR